MRTLLLLVRALTLVSTADAGIERRTPERGLWFDMSPYNTTVDPATVRELHVIFSNHLDIGFNSRAWCYNGEYNGCIGPNLTIDGQLCRPWSYAVLNANLNTFIPRALALANASRGGNTSFSYMTQPYVASLLLDCAAAGLVDWREGSTGRPLLECPNASTVKAFKAAVSAGDVWWHAFPHNPMPGLYDASLFNASLRMASRLADDLGVRRPTTYSQRDETGLTRAALPLLVAAGVGMISLGSGGDWRPPPRA